MHNACHTIARQSSTRQHQDHVHACPKPFTTPEGCIQDHVHMHCPSMQNAPQEVRGTTYKAVSRAATDDTIHPHVSEVALNPFAPPTAQQLQRFQAMPLLIPHLCSSCRASTGSITPIGTAATRDTTESPSKTTKSGSQSTLHTPGPPT